MEPDIVQLNQNGSDKCSRKQYYYYKIYYNEYCLMILHKKGKIKLGRVGIPISCGFGLGI